MAADLLTAVLQAIIFPGAVFLILLSCILEWIDRKVVAKIQGRYGPLYTGPYGLCQPMIDIAKLLFKEDITPRDADKRIFNIAPILCFSLPLMALYLIPISREALISFDGDIILLLFILTINVITVFLAGYSSASPFSIIGGIRASLQMIGYEIPMALALIGPALAAGTLSISGIINWQLSRGLWTLMLQPLGFTVLFICLLAELELVPFDIPEAETEIVAGWRTEYSGRKLALIRLGMDLKMLLAAAIIVSLYLGGSEAPPIPPTIIFLVKLVPVILLLSISHAVLARFRIDQMVSGMWRYLTPLSIIQIILISIGLGR